MAVQLLRFRVGDYQRRRRHFPFVSADAVGRYIADYVDHLTTIQCAPKDIPAYLKMEVRTLVSLYLLVARGSPSPTEMQKLAIRYAIDARREVEDLQLFSWCKESGVWNITEYPTPVIKSVGFQVPGRRIKLPDTVALLDHVFADSFSGHKLMKHIETFLGGVPGEIEGLEALERPTFHFEINEESGKEPHVQLWVNEKEVTLTTSRNLHRLLTELCRNPTPSETGRQLGSALGISNVPLYVKKLQELLEKSFPGAGSWLISKPLGWADGFAPKCRSKKLSRGRRDK